MWVRTEEYRRKMSEIKKGIIPWNKGIKTGLASTKGMKHSEETKRKMSESRKGHKLSEKTKQRISQTHKGMTLSEDIKRKISNSLIGNKCHLGIKHSEQIKEKISKSRKGKCIGEENYFYGKEHSKESKKKMSLSLIKHWDKIGRMSLGTKFLKHSGRYKQWRKAVFERDNYTCVICGKVGGQINAHHIKAFKYYPELRFEVNNGITLCNKCHYIGRKETPLFFLGG